MANHGVGCLLALARELVVACKSITEVISTASGHLPRTKARELGYMCVIIVSSS